MKWFTMFYSTLATIWMVETLHLVGNYPFRIWTWKTEAKVTDEHVTFFGLLRTDTNILYTALAMESVPERAV